MKIVNEKLTESDNMIAEVDSRKKFIVEASIYDCKLQHVLPFPRNKCIEFSVDTNKYDSILICVVGSIASQSTQ